MDNKSTKYCENCGAEIDAQAVICPKCGVPVKSVDTKADNPDDKVSFWWNVLGFIIPIVGWILWASWRKDKPKKARSICTWAWIGFTINVVIWLQEL